MSKKRKERAEQSGNSSDLNMNINIFNPITDEDSSEMIHKKIKTSEVQSVVESTKVYLVESDLSMKACSSDTSLPGLCMYMLLCGSSCKRHLSISYISTLLHIFPHQMCFLDRVGDYTRLLGLVQEYLSSLVIFVSNLF